MENDDNWKKSERMKEKKVEVMGWERMSDSGYLNQQNIPLGLGKIAFLISVSLL